jgi:tRNA threonylcarbamoyladenosine biosynthesis protein TsaB
MSENEPRILILETSGRVGQVALAQGPVLLSVRRLDEARRHARDLVPAVADLLAEQKWKSGEVNCVIVSSGPGSYTGLRVGIMSAKTFAYAVGCTLLGVNTFAALALQAEEATDCLDVIADAQQRKVYLQRFCRADPSTEWRADSALAIRSVDEWLASFPETGWVTGPGLHVYGGELPPRIRRVSAESWDPRPESLLQLGLERLLAGARDDIWSLEPLYLRPSSAEEKWQARTT